MLSKDKHDNVIIHVGVNDMMNGTDRDDLIPQIGRIGFTYKNYGVKKSYNSRFSIHKKNEKSGH